MKKLELKKRERKKQGNLVFDRKVKKLDPDIYFEFFLDQAAEAFSLFWPDAAENRLVSGPTWFYRFRRKIPDLPKSDFC